MESLLHWFAIRTSPRWELRASSELTLRGVETYLPLLGIRRNWSDRIKVVKEPLFSGYFFGRFDPNERRRVLEAPGVRQVVAIGNKPAPLGNSEIDNLRILVSANSVLLACPYLPTGQRIRICRGPLAGLEGFVVRAEQNADRIVVSVDLLQRSVAAEIDFASVRLAGVPA